MELNGIKNWQLNHFFFSRICLYVFEYKTKAKLFKLRKYRKNISTTNPISPLRDRTEFSNDAKIQVNKILKEYFNFHPLPK